MYFVKQNSVLTKIQLFKSYTTSYYRKTLFDLRNLEEIERCWRVSVRKVLGVNPKIRSYLSPGLINFLDLKDEIKRRM